MSCSILSPQMATDKSQCHLLSLPFELRDQIWSLHYHGHTIQTRAMISQGDESVVKTYITSRTFGLRITCRQIFEETAIFWKPDKWDWTLYLASETNSRLLPVLQLLKESNLGSALNKICNKICKVCITVPMDMTKECYAWSFSQIWLELRNVLPALKVIEIMCPGWENVLGDDGDVTLFNGSAYRYPDYRMYRENFSRGGFDQEFSWPAKPLQLHILADDLRWGSTNDCRVYLSTYYKFYGATSYSTPTSSWEALSERETVYHWDCVRFRVYSDTLMRLSSSRHTHGYSKEYLCDHCCLGNWDKTHWKYQDTSHPRKPRRMP